MSPRAAGQGGEQSVEVRFTYDTSGLLEVDATIESTKQTRSLVIEGNPGVLSPDAIQKRLAALAKLKVHPRDETKNAAVVARAIGPSRSGSATSGRGCAADFMTALDGEGALAIARARVALVERLDSVDDEFFL